MGRSAAPGWRACSRCRCSRSVALAGVNLAGHGRAAIAPVRQRVPARAGDLRRPRLRRAGKALPRRRLAALRLSRAVPGRFGSLPVERRVAPATRRRRPDDLGRGRRHRRGGAARRTGARGPGVRRQFPVAADPLRHRRWPRSLAGHGAPGDRARLPRQRVVRLRRGAPNAERSRDTGRSPGGASDRRRSSASSRCARCPS